MFSFQVADIAIGSNPFHYEQKYGPDAMYEEMGPHARLWRTYLDESAMHDMEMVDDSKDSVDVLLVFVSPRPQTQAQRAKHDRLVFSPL